MIHPTWIRWFIFISIYPSFCIMGLKYLNYVACGIIWSSTFTSGLETLLLLLNLRSIYFVLLLGRKPCAYKARLQVSNLFHLNPPSTIQVWLYHLQKASISMPALGCVSWVHLNFDIFTPRHFLKTFFFFYFNFTLNIFIPPPRFFTPRHKTSWFS